MAIFNVPQKRSSPVIAKAPDLQSEKIQAPFPVRSTAAVPDKRNVVQPHITQDPSHLNMHPTPISNSASSRQLPRFALVKISSIPPGALVYVDGTLRGTTPLIVKHGLGIVQLRMSHSGFRDLDKKIVLERMKNYTIEETLVPIK